MQNQELKAQYEYPTKFNKFKRIMELRNNSSTTNNPSIPDSEAEKKPQENADVTMTNATSNHVFRQLSISDPPQPLSSSPAPMSHPFGQHPFLASSTTSSTHSSTTSSMLPKKSFISRSSDMQDTPLNLTTKTEPMDENNFSSSSSTKSSIHVANGYKSDDNDPSSDSPAAMDINESMIIEDHFKRSLGSLYNKHSSTTNTSKPPPPPQSSSSSSSSSSSTSSSSKPSRTTPVSPPSYPQKSSTESPNNITPKHQNRYTNPPPIPTISPSVLINPFNFSLLTTPLDAVVAAAQLFSNNNNFFGNNNNNMLSNNSAFFNNNNSSNHFFNSFPPPVYNHSINKHHQHSPSHQQHHQQQLYSPHHHHQQQQQLSPQNSKSPSLHHSSSFHGFKSPSSSSSSSSPSPFKSTRRQRYTPPDSYQPYPHPITNPAFPTLHQASNPHQAHASTLTPPSYDSDIRKKEAKKGEHSNRSDAPPAPQASISGSVDDHFSKSLGDVWKQVQATHHGSSSSRQSSKSSLSSGSSQTPVQPPKEHQRRKQPVVSNDSSMNRLQTYISEFAPELEDLIPTSVDDHFAKALGDKWHKIQADKSSTSSSSSFSSHSSTSFSQPLFLPPSSLSQQPLSLPPPSSSSSSSSFFRSSPKSAGSHRGGLIISATAKVKSPPSFYSSPSSFVIRS